MGSYTIHVGGQVIWVLPKRIRRLHLRVLSPEARVEMTVPLNTPREEAEHFAATHLAWIERQQARLRTMPGNAATPCHDGDTVRLLGETLTLRLQYGKRQSVQEEGVLYLGVPADAGEAECLAALERYERRLLGNAVEERMGALCTRVGVMIDSWYLRRMRTRWGTCNTRTGRICLNLNLVYYPTVCLEYVMVHELCHLRDASHDPHFWALVEEFCPAWRQIRRLLDGGGQQS